MQVLNGIKQTHFQIISNVLKRYHFAKELFNNQSDTTKFV